MTAMLWYRHWLELRSAFRANVIVTLIMAALFPVAVYGIVSYFEQTGRLAKEVAAFRPALQTTPADQLLPWVVHAQFTTFLAIVIPFTLFGSGYSSQQRSGFVGPGHPSVYFTLSLPVSRFHIVSTRLVAGLAAMTGVFGLALVAHAAALLTLGRPVPFGSMAATTLLATIAGGTVLAVFGLLSVALTPIWAGVLALPVMLFLYFRRWDGAMDFLASDQPPWAAIAGLLAVAVAAFATTVLTARRKEF